MLSHVINDQQELAPAVQALSGLGADTQHQGEALTLAERTLRTNGNLVKQSQQPQGRPGEEMDALETLSNGIHVIAHDISNIASRPIFWRSMRLSELRMRVRPEKTLPWWLAKCDVWLMFPGIRLKIPTCPQNRFIIFALE